MKPPKVNQNKSPSLPVERTIVICPQCEGHGVVVLQEGLKAATVMCQFCRGKRIVERVMGYQYFQDGK